MDSEPHVVLANPAIMTVKEVAEYLRMSEAKIYRLVKQGVLPVVRIGKTWRFRKDLLDGWLKDCSTGETQPARGRTPDGQE
jgi:excisionase family DNA binding protein